MRLSMRKNGAIVSETVTDVRFDLTADVLCVGAGSAGVYAADAAAREGARVILCEIGANLGGMHVTGNVTGYYFGARGGSHEEDHEKNCRDATFFASGSQWEQKQLHLTERLAASGVRVLCRHSVTGLYFEGERVVGARVFTGKSEIAIGAAITIDATSDGHLIRMCEVKTHYGKPSDGSYVPFTVRAQYTKDGKFYSCNRDSGQMDHYNAREFSEKTVLAHAGAARLLDEGELLNLASQVGIREGLTFLGEDSVRYEDILLRRPPERVLFYAYSDLDRHGHERATDEELFQSFWVVANLATVTVSIPVPMGSVVPRGIRGLVTAGRCLSCDSYAQSAIRMNRDMFRMGECVGVAAAMAVREGVDLLAIDYDAYLRRVRALGCFAGYEERSFGFDNTYGFYLNKMRALGREPDPRYRGLAMHDYIYEPLEFDVDKSFSRLATDAPGVGIWSCFLAPDRQATANRLFSAMENAKDTLLRYNCALALGLLEDTRALPVLTEIVQNRDDFFFTDNRRSNQFRSAAALCLLGRLGTEETLPLLFEILEERELLRPMYHTLKPNYLYYPGEDRNFVYFAILTHAMMAIYKIYRRCGLPLSALHEFFSSYFAGDTVLRRITTAAPGEPSYEEVQGFLRHLLKITSEE